MASVQTRAAMLDDYGSSWKLARSTCVSTFELSITDSLLLKLIVLKLLRFSQGRLKCAVIGAIGDAYILVTTANEEEEEFRI